MSKRLSVLPSVVAEGSRENEPARRLMAGRKSFGTAFCRGANGSSNGLTTGVNTAQTTTSLSSLYSTVVKLSAENKINMQNTWALPLIDHMESLLELAPKAAVSKQNAATKSNTANSINNNSQDSAALMNFQRASCALDASIKIYSARVDDTYSTSFRVLDSLSRSGGERSGGEREADKKCENDENGDEMDENSGSAAPKSRKNGSNSRESSTLEKNVASISVSALEGGLEIDPLYHKLSASYDECGISGLLLSRLYVTAGTHIAFDSTETVDIDGIKEAGYAVGVQCATMSDAGLLPDSPAPWNDGLAVFYDDLIAYSNALKRPAFALVAAAVERAFGGSSANSVPTGGYSANDVNIICDGSDDDDDGDDGISSAIADAFAATCLPPAPAHVASTATAFDCSSPTHYATATTEHADFGSDQCFTSNVTDFVPQTPAKQSHASASGNSSRDALDLDLLSAAVSQANKPLSAAVNAITTPFKNHRSVHWKLKTKGADGVVELPKKSRINRKTKVASAAPVELHSSIRLEAIRPELFVRAKRTGVKGKSRDSEELTQAALDRMSAAGRAQHQVPAAMWGYDIIGRSFEPRFTTVDDNAPLLQRLLRLATLNQSCAHREHPAELQRCVNQMVFDDDDNEAEYGGDFECYGPATPQHPELQSVSVFADGAANASIGTDASAPEPIGLTVEDTALVPAAPKVERVRIKYDTVAKKVDVRKLKEDMWEQLSKSSLPLSGHAAVEAEFRTTAAKAQFDDASMQAAISVDAQPTPMGSMTFKQVIKDMAPSLPDAVTVPFYFITVLHLANEHNLTFRRSGEDSEPLGDFWLGSLVGPTAEHK